MNDKYSTFQQCWISSFIPLLGGMNTVFIPLERDEYHIHPSEEGWIWYSSLKIYGQCWTRKYQHSEGIFHPSREGSDQKSCHVEMIIKKKAEKNVKKSDFSSWNLKKPWKIGTFSTWDLNSWNKAQLKKKQALQENQILATETSKKYNHQKWALLSSRSLRPTDRSNS